MPRARKSLLRPAVLFAAIAIIPASASAATLPPDIGPAPQTEVDPAGAVTIYAPSTAIGFAGVRVVSPRLRLVGRYVTVRLSCPVETAGSCTGRTKVAARNRTRDSHAAGTLVLG